MFFLFPYRIALTSIIYKEVNRFTRIWIQTILPSITTTTLYIIIFGNILGSFINNTKPFSYTQFIIPGLIIMSVINNSYNNVASSFFNSKLQRNIEEILIAPISIHTIIVGYICGSVLRSIYISFVLFLVYSIFGTYYIYKYSVLITILLLTSVLFSLAGLINAILAKNFDDINIVPAFILTPLIYFSGVFYSIEFIPPFFKKISKFNLLYYIINSFRYGFLGIHEVSIIFTILLIILLIIFLYLISWKLIKNRYNLRI